MASPVQSPPQKEVAPRSFESICDAGRAAAGFGDKARYIIGDLALEIETAYGEDRIGQFANEINVPAKRVMEYRTVCGYYESSARAEFLDGVANVSYTHLRDAMTFRDVKRSYWWLEHVARRSWSPERAEYIMSRYFRMYGHPNPSHKFRPRKLDDFETTYESSANDVAIRLAKRNPDMQRKFRIVIYEVRQ